MEVVEDGHPEISSYRFLTVHLLVTMVQQKEDERECWTKRRCYRRKRMIRSLVSILLTFFSFFTYSQTYDDKIDGTRK